MIEQHEVKLRTFRRRADGALDQSAAPGQLKHMADAFSQLSRRRQKAELKTLKAMVQRLQEALMHHPDFGKDTHDG